MICTEDQGVGQARDWCRANVRAAAETWRHLRDATPGLGSFGPHDPPAAASCEERGIALDLNDEDWGSPMKKSELLNSMVSRVIATMGHTDLLVVCDGGFPCPPNVERIDLAVSANVPTLPQVLTAILGELCIERAVIASETREVAPGRFAEIGQLLAPIEPELVSHVDLKKLATQARAVIRTGDFTPYSNVILQSGVPYA